MKKKYQNPNIEIYSIDDTNVVCASGGVGIFESHEGGQSRGSYGKKVDDALK